jgi:hypothetical protein
MTLPLSESPSRAGLGGLPQIAFNGATNGDPRRAMALLFARTAAFRRPAMARSDSPWLAGATGLKSAYPEIRITGFRGGCRQQAHGL